MTTSIMELLGNDTNLRTAYMLLVAYDRIQEQAPRTKALAATQAEYSGMCKAIDRLGLAPTPAAVEMAVLDALRAAPERPQHRFAGGNEDYYTWQAAVCRDIASRLDWWRDGTVQTPVATAHS